MTDRAFAIHHAKVCLTQSRVFLARGDRAFSFTLLAWAQNARRRAAAVPKQRELFA